jgi:hypothetical protein
MPTLATQAVGSLENEILQLLWQRGPMTVHELLRAHPRDIAHTTIMTTCDRLYQKGICTREKVPGHNNRAPAIAIRRPSPAPNCCAGSSPTPAPIWAPRPRSGMRSARRWRRNQLLRPML